MYFCSHAHTMEELVDGLLLYTYFGIGEEPIPSGLGYLLIGTWTFDHKYYKVTGSQDKVTLALNVTRWVL